MFKSGSTESTPYHISGKVSIFNQPVVTVPELKGTMSASIFWYRILLAKMSISWIHEEIHWPIIHPLATIILARLKRKQMNYWRAEKRYTMLKCIYQSTIKLEFYKNWLVFELLHLKDRVNVIVFFFNGRWSRQVLQIKNGKVLKIVIRWWVFNKFDQWCHSSRIPDRSPQADWELEISKIQNNIRRPKSNKYVATRNLFG